MQPAEDREVQSARSITAEEAVLLVPSVEVPTEIYLRWMTMVGSLPCHVGSHSWVAMNELLEAAIQRPARAADRAER